VYGLEGTMTTTLDGEKHELKLGDALFIGRGRVHHHANLSSETARGLIVMHPASIGRRYFEEMAREVNVPGSPDLVKLKQIMLRHGLVPA
jgi:quercetin dioxygenase-like cupin family protein